MKGLPGYSFAWGGEVEDSAGATASLACSIPIFFGLMILIVIVLFNSIKKTLIIWLCVPLAIIGVTAGLLFFGQPFGFMALLGLMSLAGMLIKNAIVLIDEIDSELGGGKEPFAALGDSGTSRLIPVSMAALTTILGMIPLLKDAFFISMAVTIMFGLGFATDGGADGAGLRHQALGAELDQALPAPAGEVVEVAPEGVHVLSADGCGAVVIGIGLRDPRVDGGGMGKSGVVVDLAAPRFKILDARLKLQITSYFYGGRAQRALATAGGRPVAPPKARFTKRQAPPKGSHAGPLSPVAPLFSSPDRSGGPSKGV